MNPKRSAWREPMVWLLVGLPMASVAIGFALLFAAVHPGREDMEMAEHATHVGKLLVSAQNREAATAVATQGLVLRLKGDMIEAVPTDGEFPRGGKLRLTLISNDAQASQRAFQLTPSELGWRGVGSLDGAHEWLVKLEPDSAAWSLRGQWAANARATRLTP